jgi:hypothetical protein
VNTDRIVAAISAVVCLISASGVLDSLHLPPQAVIIVGGLLVGLAAVARGVWWPGTDGKASWQDIVGATLCAIAVVLGIEGHAVDELDSTNVIMLGSGIGALAAYGRAGGGPAGPAATGLVLLVGGCDQGVRRDGTCTEFASSGGIYSPDSPWETRRRACQEEVDAGRDVCISRGISGTCFVLVLGERGEWKRR